MKTRIKLTACVCMLIAFIVVADQVYVDGRAPVAAAGAPALTLADVTNTVNAIAVTPAQVTNIFSVVGPPQVTNIVTLMQYRSVFGSTGITNVWAGSAADYITETNTPPGKGADAKTAYLIWE